MAPAPAGLRIRPYEARDESAVVPMWMHGFWEMRTGGYQRISSSYAPAVVALSLAGGAFAFGFRTTAFVLATCGALIYTPIGREAHAQALWLAIQAQARATMRDIPVRWSEERGSSFSVAELDGVIVGCVATKAVHTLNGEKGAGVEAAPAEASVWRLTVAPEARRHGVGAALMGVAEEWARARGCKHVSLITGNPASQRFYASIGYIPESEVRARRVLFGSSGVPAPGSVIGYLRERMLKTRLQKMKTILVKELA